MTGIPRDHWGPHQGIGNWEAYIPYWTRTLNDWQSKFPDPAERFSEWLRLKTQEASTPGVRLVFVEQPYLQWAESVELAIKVEKLSERRQIAAEILNSED